MATSNFISMGKFFPIYAKWEDDEDDIFIIREIRDRLQSINEKLNDFVIQVEGGYYSGFQLYVNPMVELPKEVEQSKELQYVNDILKELANEFGLDKFKVVAKFSNGETMYERDDT